MLGIERSQDRAGIAPHLARIASNYGEDEWDVQGNVWKRVHRQPRRTLFTPCRVRGAPPSRALTGARVTRGKYLHDGESFEIVDQWTARGTAHAVLKGAWVGESVFFEKGFCNSDGGSLCDGNIRPLDGSSVGGCGDTHATMHIYN